MSNEFDLLDRITVRADVFGGKPIIRDMRIAVEHVLGMLAAGDSAETILTEYGISNPKTSTRACNSRIARWRASMSMTGFRFGRRREVVLDVCAAART